MSTSDSDPRWVDLEERGGWQKPTEQPSAHLRPAGLPPKPGAGQESNPAGGAPAQSSGQGSSGQTP